jgi:undecaprenyl-diphosphatase
MDAEIVQWLNSWVGRFPWWDAFMRAMVSDYLAPVLGSLVLLGLWFWGTQNTRLQNQFITMAGAAAVGLANLATLWINNIYFRARPFVEHDLTLLFYEPTDSSFPANVSAIGFAIATAVFLRRRRLGLALYGLALLYSFARVYAGVHYPTDVLGGAAIGLAMGVVAHVCFLVGSPIARRFLRVWQDFYLA